METTTSSKKRWASASLFALGLVSYFVYSKLDHANNISDAVASLPSYANEKLVLNSVNQASKSYTLDLTLEGIDGDSKNIAELKSHYEQVALQFACSEPEFTETFEQGYNINFAIKYQQKPEKIFQQIYVSQQNCSAVN